MLQFFKKLFGGKKTDYATLVAGGAVVIDVRTPSEYAMGNIKCSRNIPLNMLKNKIEDIKKLNKPVITVCASGARSGMAKAMLAGEGIEVYNGGPWRLLQKRI